MLANYLKIVITLYRVFTTEDTTEGYYTIFRKVYDIVHKLTGKKLTFRAIHGTGLHAIVMDMDNKQIGGIS
jgi:hypothetical protein